MSGLETMKLQNWQQSLNKPDYHTEDDSRYISVVKAVAMVVKLIYAWARENVVFREGKIPILMDPETKLKDFLKPDVFIDATLSKRNIGTKIMDGLFVVGLGAGFIAGKNVQIVIETNRGHNLGKIISKREAEPNTGIPGPVAGYTEERVIRAPKDGRFEGLKKIGNDVRANEKVGMVGNAEVRARIAGVLRGLLRDGTEVWKGMKLGNVDPRGIKAHC